MSKIWELQARAREKMKLKEDEQLNVIVELMDAFVETGKRSIEYDKILLDNVRKKLENDGFNIITILNQKTNKVKYEISW